MNKHTKEYLLDTALPALMISFGICGTFNIPYSKICYPFIIIIGSWILILSSIRLVKK